MSWGWKDDDDLTSLCVDRVRPRRNMFCSPSRPGAQVHKRLTCQRPERASLSVLTAARTWSAVLAASPDWNLQIVSCRWNERCVSIRLSM